MIRLWSITKIDHVTTACMNPSIPGIILPYNSSYHSGLRHTTVTHFPLKKSAHHYGTRLIFFPSFPFKK
jgi:hypothetical protein